MAPALVQHIRLICKRQATRKPKAGKEKGTGELDTDEDLEKLRERFAAVAVEDSRPLVAAGVGAR